MAKRLSPGFRHRDMSASALNATIDMAEREQTFQPPGGPPPDTPHHSFSSYHVVPIHNLCGKDLKERSIVGIKETAFDLPDIDTEDPECDPAHHAVMGTEAVYVHEVRPRGGISAVGVIPP